MPKLTKSKKQAKRQARKTAKKPAPANGRTPRRSAAFDPQETKPGKMTARRVQAQWSNNLRDQPVKFVKSVGEEAQPTLEKFYTVDDSSDPSDDETSITVAHLGRAKSQKNEVNNAILEDTSNFDHSLSTWLAQEIGLSEEEAADPQSTTYISPNEEAALETAEELADIESKSPCSPNANAPSTNYPTDKFVANVSWEEQNGIAVLSDGDAPDFEPEPRNYDLLNNDIEDSNSSEDEGDSDSAVIDEADSETSNDLQLTDSADDEIMLSSDEFSAGEMEVDSDVSDSAARDYLDNMSDLDDDQIFAMASMSNVAEHEDYNVMDDVALDERDAYFDDLIGSGFDIRELKRQQRANKAQKNKKQSLLKDLRRANKTGALQLLWMKYPHTITVYEVVDELNTYAKLRSIQPKPLTFPPLDSDANWYIKQFAEYMGLTSAVHGTRESKCVVVTTNNHTHGRALSGEITKLTKRRQNFRRSDAGQHSEEFSAALHQVVQTVILKGSHSNKPSKEAKANLCKAYTMDRKKMADKVIEAMLSGEFLDPNYVSGPRASTIDKKLKAASAKVRDGHVVGHNACAIETTNFGHRLLLQMGWTSGTGLGKEKAGITAPLPATVKLTRGGLGG